LANLLEERERIFKFKEDELEMYLQFSDKHYTLMRKKGIGPNDYDLLISELTSAVKRGPTCIISNDFPLLYSWRDILKIEGKNPSQLGFFIRKDFNGFDRAYSKKV